MRPYLPLLIDSLSAEQKGLLKQLTKAERVAFFTTIVGKKSAGRPPDKDTAMLMPTYERLLDSLRESKGVSIEEAGRIAAKRMGLPKVKVPAVLQRLKKIKRSRVKVRN